MQLSEHLSVAEYIKSDTAKRKGIDNSMTPEHTENAKKLALNVFEKIRTHFNKPIYLSSGYRSKALNDAIGGSSSTSQHMTGEAMDLDQDDRGTGVSNADVFNFVKANVEFDQLIWEYGDDKNPDWVHVSYKGNGTQRKQILRCKRINGQPKYEPYA